MTTDTDTLTILKLLAKGRPIDFVAEATGVEAKLVLKFAETHGWPDRAKLSDAMHCMEIDALDAIPERAPGPVAEMPRLVAPPSTSRPAPAPSPQVPARPAVSAPAQGGTLNGAHPPGPSVEQLVRACKRSEFKRTQALGVKLTELADRVSAALRAEREDAEAKVKRTEAVTAAQAEVKRLEKALAEARAKAVAAGAPGGVRGGECICSACDAHLANPQALGAHKRHKHGIPSTNPRSTA